MTESSKVWYIETSKTILWGERKMDVTYAHVKFRQKQRAKFRETTSKGFESLTKKTKKVVNHV